MGQSLTTRSRFVQAATLTLAVLLLLAAFVRNDAGAVAPDGEPFERTWARTDKPVADLEVDRTWMWGPEANTEGRFEPYVEGHNNGRFVQYFDKSRMEITTDESVPYDDPWYVTNGLLVVELMTGELQLGDDTFEQHSRADVNVAGDPDGTTGPTYSSLSGLLDADAATIGAGIDAVVDRFGIPSSNPAFLAEGVTVAVHVPDTDHTVASVFWDFMNSDGLVWQGDQFVTDQLFENPFYATGFPITEAYWTNVPLDGVATDVLLQCFERRCLTYTPDNKDGWKVEAGNVGQHYYTWRYEQIPSEVEPTATATSTATATQTVEPTATGPSVLTTGYMKIDAVTQLGPDMNREMGVLIQNGQGVRIQMEGWELHDDSGLLFTFPNLVVRPDLYATVVNCSGQDNVSDRFAFMHIGRCVSPFPDGKFYLYDSYGTLIFSYP